MDRAFSISSLYLILFLVIFHRVQSVNDIVEDTCKKIAAKDQQVNFDFCVKSLGSDPESYKADLEGLGLIGIKLLQANLTNTMEYIKQLLKQKLEPSLLKALSLCLDTYTSSTYGTDMISAYKAKIYYEVINWGSAVATSEDTCDTQVSRKRGMVPPLTKRNADILQSCLIALWIVEILDGIA
ncbi:hypothetical protein ACJRO7_030358 [Eucalyptus globulus]|uniref:Pectinesterase inhibitor domain-containing protein n=1 Tax=Eucalyptus globulus TaxID=34317 RepID=A0ABD3JH29_EUCGL